MGFLTNALGSVDKKHVIRILHSCYTFIVKGLFMNHKLFFVLCNVVFSYASENCLSIGFYSEANGKTQEDRFSVDSIARETKDFFCVYDGHGGSRASEYLKNNLALCFAASLKTCATKKEAFELAFKKIEKHILNNMMDGSTAVAVYLENNVAHVAWVGDSRAVVGSNDSNVVFATRDHDLERQDERERVFAAKGVLFREKAKNGVTGKWRINCLEMTRSIGDAGPKGLVKSRRQSTFEPVSRIIKGTELFWQQWPGEKNLSHSVVAAPLQGQVIAEPEYAEISLTEKDRWFIIASDGLWDKMKNEEAVKMVADLARQYCSLENIAETLVRKAIGGGSKDNVTVMIIDLLNR